MAIKNNEIVKHAECTGRSLLSGESAGKVRVFATTVIRGSEDSELTGFLLEIDWRANGIKKQIPIPLDTRHPFWNSRGGNRGGRGLMYHNGILYVATAMSILLYDDNLNRIGEITHPHLGGLHEIYIDDNGIWVTSTLHDLIIKLDFNGKMIEEWYGCQSKHLQKEFDFQDRKLNLSLAFPAENFVQHYENYCKEEIFHLNSVFPHNHSLYALSSRMKAFIRVKPDIKVVIKDNDLRAPHNGIIPVENQVIINDTRNQCLRIYSLETGERLLSMFTPVFGAPQKSAQFASYGWQRGLFPLKHPLYLVGTSPAAVFEVDIQKGLIGQVCRIDTDVRHCIHGLTAVKD